MGFLHSSRTKGRVSASLAAASQVRFVGMEGDGDTATLLHFQVPPFGAVVRELFQQQKLWDDTPHPDDTAFELLGAAFDDVAERRADSNRFDTGLLRRIVGYRRVLKRGVHRITLPDARLRKAAHVDEAVVEAACELAAATPEPKRVRVVGRVDVIGASQAVLKLHVRAGQSVTALWEGLSPVDDLRHYFNRDVVVEGTGVFRPSGGLLRIDADAIAVATPSDDAFRRIPSGQVRRDFRAALRLRTAEPSVYARILGSIPAEESEEEFAAAVEALS
jgi:hypothetical protein